MELKVKAIGQRSRSNMEIGFFCLISENDRGQVNVKVKRRSKIKVTKVNIMGQGHHMEVRGQGYDGQEGSRSNIVRFSLLRNRIAGSIAFSLFIYIVACQWGGGSPTNHPGSRYQQDMGQRSFGPLTDRANLVTNYQNLNLKDGPYTGPALLRQSEPGMSKYI